MQAGTWMALGAGLFATWVAAAITDPVMPFGWSLIVAITVGIVAMLATAWIYDRTQVGKGNREDPAETARWEAEKRQP